MPSGCAIQSGHIIGDCRASIGGLKAVFIAEFENVESIVETTGLVTAINKVLGKRFYKFEVPRATANASSNGTGSEQFGSFFYTHQVVFPINKRDATTANIIRTLAKNKCLVVTLDMDGIYRMYGKDNGLYVTTVDSGSGTASGDRQGYNLTLSGEEKDDFLQVDNSTGNDLEVVG